jgi:hypothetical protein
MAKRISATKEGETMTRKDYIKLADVLFTARTWAEPWEPSKDRTEVHQTVDWIAGKIAIALHDDNPRFDREHFLAVVRGERSLNSRPPRNGPALARHFDKVDVPQEG